MNRTAPKENGVLRFLYQTAIGRLMLKVISAPFFSRLCGAFLSSFLSRPFIPGFLRRNGIDLSEYETDRFPSYNACFTRQIKSECRPISSEPDALISPCDGLVSCYLIQDGTVLPIKQSEYTVASLLKNDELAAEYEGGYCFVFRLCVNHYHHYCYIDNGTKGDNTFIKGRLHTVRPIALRTLPVFTENCREYTVMETEHFGKVVQVEIGALMVGKIQNHHGTYSMTRGEEKGLFLYGGSSIAVLLKKDAITPDTDLLSATVKGNEIPVKMGEIIGRSRIDTAKEVR